VLERNRKAQPGQSMKDVVIMPFGKKSIRSPWVFDSNQRDFDVLLLTYHAPEELPDLDMKSSHYRVLDMRDFKWIMIRKLFLQHPELVQQYEYFFFADDDIEIGKRNICILFSLMRKYQLLMSQPVLSGDSFKSWRVLRRKFFSGIRYLSSVELMCPIMHQDANRDLMDTYDLNNSGWGIDILWGEVIRKKYGSKRIAVFDQLIARHTRPVGKGELYQKLGKSGVEERDEIFQKYHIQKTEISELPLPENGFLSKRRSYFEIRRFLHDYPGE
jgi:hypothetical protein